MTGVKSYIEGRSKFIVLDVNLYLAEFIVHQEFQSVFVVAESCHMGCRPALKVLFVGINLFFNVKLEKLLMVILNAGVQDKRSHIV